MRLRLSLIGMVLSATSAAAQTTVTLNQPAQHVVYATVRGGSYANKNQPTLLATRASDTPEYERRALLKFDTQNTIPAGASISSALLTVTVKTGSGDARRTVAAYQVTTSWTETEVTWNRRKSTDDWGTAGGDLGSKLDDAVVGNAAGTKVTFDVTALVKQAVAGNLGSSRYTRIALIDKDGPTSESYRELYTPTDSNTSARPVLKVTLGGSSIPAAPPPPPTSSGGGSTLRVLHWNTHHGGVGTDGKLDQSRLMSWVAKINPDIVSMNEVERYTGWGNVDGPAVLASLLTSKTGKTWYSKFQTASGGSKGNGNLILSRFPFDSTDTGLLSYTRSIVNATINVNGRTINLFSTHLDADSTSYRLREIGEVKGWAGGMAELRIVCGDFNAWPGSSENSAMKTAYYDSWAVAQANGTDIAYSGNTAGNTRNSRIDYIYYSRGASRLTLKSSQVFDTRDSRGVMPSDHRPVLSVFTVQ